MASIPNLKTFKKQSGGLGRGVVPLRDANEVDRIQSRHSDQRTKDKIIEQTDQDASISRLSAVELGYLNDAFAKDLNVGNSLQRRFPIINRGTYVRTSAIDRLTEEFLAAHVGAKKQIISLGAGSDTRAFRFLSSRPESDILYHELDLPTNTAQKISCIKKSQQLMSCIESGSRKQRLGVAEDMVSINSDGTALYSPVYNVHPFDLRAVNQSGSDSASEILALRGLDSALPTLLISECCLIYLSPIEADAILKHFTTSLFPASTPLGLIIYEPINPNDPFGKVMVQNLAARGIELQTLKRYGSLERQEARMRAMGFYSGGRAKDVDYIMERWISTSEKERVAKLEMLDEVEEWKMLAQHYCVAWGWRDSNVEKSSDFFQSWDLKDTSKTTNG